MPITICIDNSQSGWRQQQNRSYQPCHKQTNCQWMVCQSHHCHKQRGALAFSHFKIWILHQSLWQWSNAYKQHNKEFSFAMAVFTCHLFCAQFLATVALHHCQSFNYSGWYFMISSSMFLYEHLAFFVLHKPQNILAKKIRNCQAKAVKADMIHHPQTYTWLEKINAFSLSLDCITWW